MRCSTRLRIGCIHAPASTSAAIAPSKNFSQNRRRALALFDLAPSPSDASLPASFASAPSRCGRNDSSFSRKRRVSTGASPLLPTATMTGERSTIAGTMKRDSSRSSTTLTGMLRRSAWWATHALIELLVGRGDRQTRAVEMLGVELIGDVCDDAGSNLLRPASRSAPARRRVTAAPARNSKSILRAATSPPPTTSDGLVRRGEGRSGSSPWRACWSGLYWFNRLLGDRRAPRLDLQRDHAATRLQTALARIRVLPPPAARARIGAGSTARVQGAQPMLGKPLSCSGLYGRLRALM